MKTEYVVTSGEDSIVTFTSKPDAIAWYESLQADNRPAHVEMVTRMTIRDFDPVRHGTFVA